MDLIKLINSRFISLHLIFWVGVWFFFVYFFSYNSTDSNYVTWFSTFLLPVTMITTYFVVYFLIPKYLLRKKYLLFTLYSVYTVVISTWLILMTIFASLIFLSNLKIEKMPPMSKNYIFVLILVYLVVLLVSFVNLLSHNFKTESKNKELENKILSTQLQIKDQELQYLKKQIHPHFLFNTLNTIYGFALKGSKNTPDIILKLSNLLDYILYQVNKPKVSLREEILHLQEYIDLERIRFQDTLKISFDSEIGNGEKFIPPMLLIPFVENAFKHGDLIEGFLHIFIEIRLIDESLNFSIKNSVKKATKKQKESGIGLENIKKRLGLIYPDNHFLKIRSEGEWYEVELKIHKI
ncbi:sensor histidine kinase [Lutimonas saemankumensis]|uniref:sensor histidine kinase n=1 Tax=Lutimonas saemankumensis TaxID=483016 RepID=UPI001CD30756|nr:sensor histidine kinase [Lutimonas saemankumensis]MCA0932749.1 sensor histidine kinase [Lutimonas saemankumensis]